jgi:FAD/FMN-containing dehydrogenase
MLCLVPLELARRPVQVVGMKVVLANGTLLDVSPKINRHIWRAMGVSVGRLGIIAELTLRIKPQQAVQKKVEEQSLATWLAQLKLIQDSECWRARGPQRWGAVWRGLG